MTQKAYSSLTVSDEVKAELERRKKALQKHIGRAVSYDELLRTMLGWRIQ